MVDRFQAGRIGGLLPMPTRVIESTSDVAYSIVRPTVLRGLVCLVSRFPISMRNVSDTNTLSTFADLHDLRHHNVVYYEAMRSHYRTIVPLACTSYSYSICPLVVRLPSHVHLRSSVYSELCYPQLCGVHPQGQATTGPPSQRRTHVKLVGTHVPCAAVG